MQRRLNIIERILKGIKLPHAEEVSDLDRDYKAIYKMLERRGATESIGMSKDVDKSLIWFRRRRGT
jgi:hypothetical protein